MPHGAATATLDRSDKPRYSELYDQLAAVQKSRRGQAYTVLVNRPLGRRAAAGAYLMGLTPNQVTVISALFTAAGIGLLASGPKSVFTAVGVAALLLLGYALDSADGQLARLRGGGSLAGEWLDHVLDSAKVVAIHLAVAIFLHRVGDMSEVVLLVPLGFSVIAVVNFFAMVLGDQLRASAPGRQAEPQSVASLLIRLPHDYGFLCLVFVLAAWPAVLLAAYAGCFAYNTVFIGVSLSRSFREMRRLDALDHTETPRR